MQGIPLRVQQRRLGISDRPSGMMVGNALSLNVLERLLVRMLRACGLRKPVKDRWAGLGVPAALKSSLFADICECRPMLVQRARGSLRCTPALTVSSCARRTHANSHAHAHLYPGSAPRTDETLAEHTRICQRKPRHMAPPRPPRHPVARSPTAHITHRD